MKWWGPITTILFASTVWASPKTDFIYAIDSVEDVILNKYGLTEYKKRTRGWDPIPKLADLRNRINSTPDSLLNRQNVRVELSRIILGAGDLHLRATWISTERSLLPFQIRSAISPTGQKQFRIAWADGNSGLDIKWGDQVVSINGVDCETLLNRLSPSSITPDHFKRQLEGSLTERFGYRGEASEQGPVVIRIRRGNTEHDVKTSWNYKPDLIGFPGDRNPMTPSPFFDPPNLNQNFWFIGGRETYVLPMGPLVTASRPDEFFKANIQKVGAKQIGYIRIPSFNAGNFDAAVAQFANWIATFESQTSALIIDLLNNPGGSLSFSHALLSFLVDSPIEANRVRRVIDFSDITKANMFLFATERVTDDRSAEAVLKTIYGPTFFGLPLDKNLVEAQREESKGFLKAWERGSFVTDSIPYQGVTKIYPRTAPTSNGLPAIRYSKKIILVVNGQTMSAGEMFSAILQDAGRATVFGERTPGAGGTQKDVLIPNRIGLEKLSLADGLVTRPNGQEIEDNGITPDHSQPLTANDLLNGYADFKAALIKLVIQ